MRRLALVLLLFAAVCSPALASDDCCQRSWESPQMLADLISQMCVVALAGALVVLRRSVEWWRAR